MSLVRRGPDIVVPTVGRPSLATLLDALAREAVPGRVLVVDDRVDASTPLLPADRPGVVVLRGRAAGPAAARNVGWRGADPSSGWVVFLDDDVVPDAGWVDGLRADLDAAAADPSVVAVQGRIRVPLPADRRPTDWERNVAALESASWATADMAVRVDALRGAGGFDERFPRAYREDADLALRLLDTGGRLVCGRRSITHPVRPAPWHVSVRLQRGNADDATMRRLHGRDWRARAGAPPGAFRRHAAVTAALVTGLVSGAAGWRRAAAAALGTWAAGTAAFAARRIAPGPRDAGEVAAMVATSVAIPPAAIWHRLAGELRGRRSRPSARAVLFDRDGTLVHDVPYNGDPALVRPVDGAREAIAEVRGAGLRVGIVSNQSGVARGLLDREQVSAVNERVDQLLGPFDVVEVCVHGPDEGCACRKPRPGLVHRAAAALGVAPSECVVIGDIGADVDAAVAAGARAVLVPTGATREDEVVAARAMPPAQVAVAADLAAACRMAVRWS